MNLPLSSPAVSPFPQDDAPWLWFDVDDVLVHAAPLFQESLDRWSGTTMPWEKWPHNQFHKFYGVKDEDADTLTQLRKIWQDERILERAPLYDDVADTLRRLHEEEGYQLGLLTARAWHPDGVAITQAMADTHRLPVSKIISMDYSGTKAEFLQKTGTRVVGFIDDTVRHVEGCVNVGINAVLMHQPWNTEASHLPRVHRLADYPAWLRTLSEPAPDAAEETFRARRPRRPR